MTATTIIVNGACSSSNPKLGPGWRWFHPCHTHTAAQAQAQLHTNPPPPPPPAITASPPSLNYSSTQTRFCLLIPFPPGCGPNVNRCHRLRLSMSLTNHSSSATPDQSSQIVSKFYDAINRRDFAALEDLIALNCVYEDLVFPRPFVGRQAILMFFKQFMDSINADLQFSIDDISSEEEDSSAVGVTWHLEWRGKPFPFSKGCSFYRLEMVDGQKQIVYGRDCVEPAIKPGEAALVAIRAVTWLLQKFPSLAG
ncbi:uncharacterized protein LOC127257096 [Andrographis paniculata]|uniref:uncharacterized protein LOC127257096 n=1 Tax=Andrographis paniculata TaxID=175694 RepID=UPI0021E8585F|nr:uncharacterized protein LOC127257096 [Andrographis paniculata]